MATNCLSSAIIEAPIEDVWEHLKDFRFPSKFFSSVSSVEIIGSPFQVGSVRVVKWKSGEVQTHKLLELSEQFLKISWELESSENIEECDGLLTTLQLRRVTETNHTYISWTSWFSANRTSSFMKWITKATQENISEIRQVITGKRIPVLRHIHEGPSTRVLWLCYELGIPIRVIVKDLFPKDNLRESGQEFDLLRSTTGKLLMDPTGNLNPAFLTEEKETLHESGAIILHLLEQYDKSFKFHPPPSTKGRGTFYQWFFFTTATCDPLLLSSYIDLFVNLQEERNEEQLLINKQKWLDVVCEVLEKWITSNGGYIHGKEFSAADVMVGYTINLADSLGWLPEDNQVLQDYFQRLKQRSAFQKAFDPPE